MRVKLAMGNQDISMIWNILKILNIWFRELYLMSPPLIIVEFTLMMKVMNILWK